VPTEVIPANHPTDDVPSRPIRPPDADTRLADLARTQGVEAAAERELLPPLFDDDELEEFHRWLRKIRHYDCQCECH
jgi:hypothetical protein